MAWKTFCFCFLNMVFAAVLFLKLKLSKWSYSYGVLFEAALLSDGVVLARYESTILIVNLCLWTCLFK